MFLFRACIYVVAAAIAVSATPTPLPTPITPLNLRNSPEDPCAIVSSSSSAQKLVTPTAVPTVSAELAHQCLNSVPLNKTAASELVDSIGPYLEWQSSSAWLKDPPKDYDFSAHDIFAALESVKKNLASDKYANEYEFQTDLYLVFARAHDGHLAFFPDALSRAFDFGRQRSLVSLSEDGKSIPVIKIFEDVIFNPETASAVTKINGIDASTYILDFNNQVTSQQDVDGAYNTMFFEKSMTAQGGPNGYFSGGGRTRFIYAGPTTTFTFENGTSLELENIAKVRGNFTLVEDGASFYDRFCTPAPLENKREPIQPPSPYHVVPGYPPAVIKTNGTEVSGYYMDGEGYRDVAVLSVLSFGASNPREFQKVVEDFIVDAKRDGKTKLVIDLSTNGGGLIFLGYDLFRQLFPNITQDGYSRWRNGDTFGTISQIYSAESVNFDPSIASEEQIFLAQSAFNYKMDLNVSTLPFNSYEAKFGPYLTKEDKFSNLMQWNLNDPLLTTNSTFGLGTDVTGYRSRTNFTQPFAAEDIILLYDGFCASTCTIFSQFMRTLGGVKSIAMGGRPKEGHIQGIGGVKGAQILQFQDIYEYAQLALLNASESQSASLRRLSTLPFQRSVASAVNVRDAILPNHISDGTPAQFLREESDCRLFYTKSMITDVTALWKAAADSAFNGKECAYGELPRRPDSVSVTGGANTGAMVGETKFVTVTEKIPVQNDRWLTIHNQRIIE